MKNILNLNLGYVYLNSWWYSQKFNRAAITQENSRNNIFQSNSELIKETTVHHVQRELLHYPGPVGLTFRWNYGSFAIFFYAILIITGIKLIFYYVPDIEKAFEIEAFGEQIVLYMDYLQIPLIIIFIKILHSIWMALENYSMTNYNVNDPILVQNWWIRKYLRLPDRKSKEAILLEKLFTVGPLVMISYIILQNTGLSVGDNTTYNISSQSDNVILKIQGNQWDWDYKFSIKKINKSNVCLDLNSTYSNFDAKYQNLNILFNKTKSIITIASSFIFFYLNPSPGIKIVYYLKRIFYVFNMLINKNKIKALACGAGVSKSTALANQTTEIQLIKSAYPIYPMRPHIYSLLTNQFLNKKTIQPSIELFYHSNKLQNLQNDIIATEKLATGSILSLAEEEEESYRILKLKEEFYEKQFALNLALFSYYRQNDISTQFFDQDDDIKKFHLVLKKLAYMFPKILLFLEPNGSHGDSLRSFNAKMASLEFVTIKYKDRPISATSCIGLEKLDYVIELENSKKLIGIQCKRWDQRLHLSYNDVMRDLYKLQADYPEHLDTNLDNPRTVIPITLIFIDISDWSREDQIFIQNIHYLLKKHQNLFQNYVFVDKDPYIKIGDIYNKLKSYSELEILSEEAVKKYPTNNVLATKGQEDYFKELKRGNPVFNKNYSQFLQYIEIYENLQEVPKKKKAKAFDLYANAIVVRPGFNQNIGSLNKYIKPGYLKHPGDKVFRPKLDKDRGFKTIEPSYGTEDRIDRPKK
jgi:hypothetical protein